MEIKRKKIIKQKILILFKSIQPLLMFLEHLWRFEPFLIVKLESLNCPQFAKRISKSHSHCWKGFKYPKDAGKPNHKNSHHKTKNRGSSGNDT